MKTKVCSGDVIVFEAYLFQAYSLFKREIAKDLNLFMSQKDHWRGVKLIFRFKISNLQEAWSQNWNPTIFDMASSQFYALAVSYF